MDRLAFMIATLCIFLCLCNGYDGGSVTESGFILMPMMLSSVITRLLRGIVVSKSSYRKLMVISGLFVVAGTSALSTISAICRYFVPYRKKSLFSSASNDKGNHCLSQLYCGYFSLGTHSGYIRFCMYYEHGQYWYGKRKKDE